MGQGFDLSQTDLRDVVAAAPPSAIAIMSTRFFVEAEEVRAAGKREPNILLVPWLGAKQSTTGTGLCSIWG